MHSSQIMFGINMGTVLLTIEACLVAQTILMMIWFVMWMTRKR